MDRWRVKVYGIATQRARPAAELEVAAYEIAESRLGTVSSGNDHGAAILGVHQGYTDNLVFVSWWVAQNELRHLVFRSPLEEPHRLEPSVRHAPIGCLWDLHVLGFEARCWLEDVIKSRRWSAIDSYLGRGLTCDV